jgi:hypothetical protein
MLGHQNDINEKLDEGIEAKLKIEEDKDAAAEKLSFAQQKEMAEIELHNDDLQFQEQEFNDLSQRYTTDNKYLQELMDKEKQL